MNIWELVVLLKIDYPTVEADTWSGEIQNIILVAGYGCLIAAAYKARVYLHSFMLPTSRWWHSPPQRLLWS